MKRYGKIAIGVAGGLVWCVLVHAGDSVKPANPYVKIAARNAFDLLPPAAVVAPEIPGKPLPKILLHGIISIFGQGQVLIEVVASQNSPVARTTDSSYILAEGERKNDVEVMHIEANTGTAVFNNHGTVQQISLTDFHVSAAGAIMPPLPAR